MKPGAKILVLGATGNTGRVVAQLLQASGEPVRTAARSGMPESVDHVRFAWGDAATYAAALTGVERLYLVAPVGVADPLPLVAPFLAQALRGGLRRVVVLSSSAVASGDPGLGRIDQLARETAPEWAILRPSWFMQNFVGSHPLADGIRARSEIVTATGEGRLPFVDAHDIAGCAAALLRADGIVNGEHLVTGPQALSYGEAAVLVGGAAGRPVRHIDIGYDALAQRLVAGGFTPEFAAALAALDGEIRAGRQSRISDTVLRLTGRPARSLRGFLDAHRHLLAGG